MTLHAASWGNYDHSMLRSLIIVAVASLLLILSAKVSILFYPTPGAMQTFVVIGLGLGLAAAAVFPGAWRFLKARGLG